MYELLEKYAEENKTILCFGIDPNLEKIKGKGSLEEKILNYYFEITDKLLDESQISAIKPNYAYFAQYGFEGLSALKNIIDRYKGKTFVILDAKRGDIGRSSEAYAREVFDFWSADAVTIHSYMGSDSVLPFIRKDKTAYMMCRTSNKGAEDFEELESNGKKIYEYVAEKSVEWNVGIVVGATSDAIKKIVKITGNKIPLLIPGIGAQGGDLKLVLDAIKSNPNIHRINSSSGIAYAYLKDKGKPVESALNETKRLNEVIRANVYL